MDLETPNQPESRRPVRLARRPSIGCHIACVLAIQDFVTNGVGPIDPVDLVKSALMEEAGEYHGVLPVRTQCRYPIEIG